MRYLVLIGIATGLALTAAVLATVAGHLARPAEGTGEPRVSSTLVAFAAAAAAVGCLAALALTLLWLLAPVFFSGGD